MRKITNYFLNGLLFLVPVVLTGYVLYLVFVTIDGLMQINIPGWGVIPGVGFLSTLLLVITVGFLVSNFLTQRIMLAVDKLLSKLPLVKLIYGSIKDLINAFAGDKKSFDKPVLVRLSPTSHAHVLGFLTSESLNRFGLEDFVSVYIPQSYNFAGQLLIFPREQVVPLPTGSAETMTFIVSGGVSGN